MSAKRWRKPAGKARIRLPAATGQLRRAEKSAGVRADSRDWDEGNLHPGLPPLTFNQWVVGSSPTRVTTENRKRKPKTRGATVSSRPLYAVFAESFAKLPSSGSDRDILDQEECPSTPLLPVAPQQYMGMGIHRQTDLRRLKDLHDHAGRDALPKGKIAQECRRSWR